MANCHNDEPCCFEAVVPSLVAPDMNFILNAMSDRLIKSLRARTQWMSVMIWLGVVGTVAGGAGMFLSPWFAVLIGVTVVSSFIGVRSFTASARQLAKVMGDLTARNVPCVLSYRYLLESLKHVINGENKLRLVLEDEPLAAEAERLAKVLAQVPMTDDVSDEARRVYATLKGYNVKV